LAAIAAELEAVEAFRARSGAHVDALTRAAANLRADIWFAENPRAAVGSTLRGLNTGRRRCV
jgi:hypothetical protein